MNPEPAEKTESEVLFEQYLCSNGYDDWDYESELPGQQKRPDYRLYLAGRSLLFEVKELREKRPLPQGAVNFNPYTSVRSEINEARIKFRRLKDHCCSLVVYNVDDWEARLDPLVVFGAMLGDLGLTMNFDPAAGRMVAGSEQEAFLERGKMIRYKTGEPQNTTISSIVVLRRFRVPDLEFERAVQRESSRRQAEAQRALTPKEELQVRWEMYDRHPIKVQEVPCVRVVENPFARIAFPRNVFLGPFDERWAMEESPERTFVGQELEEIERAEAAGS